MVDLLSRATLLLAIALPLLAGCSHGGDRSSETTPPPERTERGADARDSRDEEDVPTAEPREISTDRVNRDDPGSGTASRRASQGTVEEGKGYLIADQPGEAARRFERATRIDPSNGFAWYWLGRARVDLGDRRGAVGVLEKAESLLGPYPAWRDRASALLARIR